MKSKFLIISAILFSHVAIAQEPLKIKNIGIGTSLEEINKNNFECNKSTLHPELTECKSINEFTVSNAKVNMTLKLTNERVIEIFCYYDHDYYEQIRDAFLNKFGEPTYKKNDVVYNAMGAAFSNDKHMWIDNGDKLTMSERVGKINNSVFVLTSEESRARDKEDNERKKLHNNSDI